MAERDDRKGERREARVDPPHGPGDAGEEHRADGEAEREEVEIAGVDLVTSLARLDLEAALAYEIAAALCEDEDLERHLREFARDHRVHLEALNEALEAEGETAVVSPAVPGSPVLAGLVTITGPLGDEVIVVTLLGNEQLTNLGYDAALAYEWDDETEAMLRRFQQDEERHLAWLAQKHDALGGHAARPDAPPA